MYLYLSIRSSLFIISWAKLLHELVKALYCELSFQITCIAYVRCYLEAAIASIFIFLKVFSNYKKLTTKLTFPGKYFISKSL